MVRKLVLTGGIMLTSEESEFLRVLQALLFSVGFVAVHFSVKPLKRCAYELTPCRPRCACDECCGAAQG